jgi:hypothetical protein
VNKIGVSQPWGNRTINENIKEEVWTRKFINGTFLNYNYIISEIYMHSYPKKLSLKFLIFIPTWSVSKKVHILYLTKLISLVKSVLTLKYNKNVSVTFKVIPHLFKDPVMLGKWLKLEDDHVKLKFKLRKLLHKIKSKRWYSY